MATRSRIGIELPTGEVKSVYCHWDGYPSRRIPLLLTHYSEREKVEQLIELGSICSLRPRLAPNEGEIHTMDNDIKDVTLSYARDMNQSDFVTTNISKGKEDFRSGDIEEWGYLFTLDNEWIYAEGKYPENSPFMKATDFKEEILEPNNAY
jgi:hypothetical protein